MSNKQRIVLFCQGGAGDVLAHTPMIRGFRRDYPEDEIIVLSTYSHLLDHNKNIDTLIPLNNPKDFYNEYVHKKPVRFFKKHFVYDAILDEPAQGTKCLPEFICSLYGTTYDGGPLDYFITDYEKRMADTFVNQYSYLNLPVVLLHCTGSIPSEGRPHKVHIMKDLNVETASQLVKNHADKALFIHIGLEGEPKVEGAIDALGMTMREAAALIPHSKTFIFIESIFAHISNALNKTGIVVFNNTSPDFFGYSNNFNISHSGGCEDWPCNRPVGALLDMGAGYKNPKTREPILWECSHLNCAKMPYNELEASFLEALNKALVESKGNQELAKVRNLPPPPKIQKPIQSVSSGKVSPNDQHNNPSVELPDISTVEMPEKNDEPE